MCERAAYYASVDVKGEGRYRVTIFIRNNAINTRDKQIVNYYFACSLLKSVNKNMRPRQAVELITLLNLTSSYSSDVILIKQFTLIEIRSQVGKLIVNKICKKVYHFFKD